MDLNKDWTLLYIRWASQMAQVKNPPASAGKLQETWVWFLVGNDSWRSKWQPILVFLPRKSHGQKSLVGYSSWGCRRVRHNCAWARTQGYIKWWHRFSDLLELLTMVELTDLLERNSDFQFFLSYYSVVFSLELSVFPNRVIKGSRDSPGDKCTEYHRHRTQSLEEGNKNLFTFVWDISSSPRSFLCWMFSICLPDHSQPFSTPVAQQKTDITAKCGHGTDMHKENGTAEEHTCHTGPVAVNITVTFTLSSVCLYETPVLWSENFTVCWVIHELIHICSSAV